MKANRKTMLGVALAVAVIALAGVGYAAYAGYKAETSSANDQIKAEYAVINLTASGDATGDVYSGLTLPVEYNTKNDGTTVTYQLNADGALTIEIRFNIAKTNVETDDYELKVSGLSNWSVPGATGAWTLTGATIATNATTATITGTTTVLNAAVLTYTLTPSGTYVEGPIGTSGVIEFDDLEFTLTHVSA